MPQNIYDQPDFFEGYSQLARSKGGLDEAPEWPTVRSLLPDLADARILDLGCGFGAFDRWAVAQGANHVLAVDLSEKMLARAKALTTTDRIRYVRGDLAQLEEYTADFDLIYSALALHYVADVAQLFIDMRRCLRGGGSLVVTIEHPIYTAPVNPGWKTNADGETYWPLSDYFQEGKRVTNWIAEGVVKYHRSISTYIGAMLEAGFVIRSLVEWVPTAADLSAHPEWANEVHRPMFLILRADAA